MLYLNNFWSQINSIKVDKRKMSRLDGKLNHSKAITSQSQLLCWLFNIPQIRILREQDVDLANLQELVFSSYHVGLRYPNLGCQALQKVSISTEPSFWAQIWQVLIKRKQKEKDLRQGVPRGPFQLVTLWRTQKTWQNWKEHTIEKGKAHLLFYFTMCVCMRAHECAHVGIYAGNWCQLPSLITTHHILF